MSHKLLAAVSACLLVGLGMLVATTMTTSASASASASGSAGKNCSGKSCDGKPSRSSSTSSTSSTTSTATAESTTTAAATTAPTTTTTATTTAPATTTTTATTTTAADPISGKSSSIYWGAYIDGNDTYGSSYGDAPWDSNTWNRFESDAGKGVSIVHWGVPAPWTSSFDYQLSAHQKVLTAGRLELLDMNSGSARLRDIAAGMYDRSITDWAQQAKAFAHPFFLRWNWEMNGSWYGWGTTPSNANTAADYVNSWRHMHDLFARAGATNVTWVWCPNVSFNGSTPLASLYPGDAYVDWTCLDGYNKGGSQWTSFASIFGASYDSLRQIAPSKPIMIGETSSSELGGSKAGWTSDALAQLPAAFPQVKALLWFNWRINEGGTTWPWQIESSSTAQAAFAAAVASPYFAAGGNLGALPPLVPIKPLQ